MATLVSLQLVRVAGLRDHHATSYLISGRRSGVVQNSRLFHGSGLKIASHPRVGSFQGGGALFNPLWSHLLISKSNAYVRASRLPIMASSVAPVPMEQEIKQIAVMFVNYGGHLLRRTAALFQMCPPLIAEVAPAVGLVTYSIWGLGPMARMLRKYVFKRNDKKWDESRTYNIMASYMRPILLWIGIILICRVFDPVMLRTEASQAIKQRFVNFVRSLSTVLAFAFCTASLTQQVQRFMMENQDAEDSRNVGVQFIGNTVYTSVWVAAVCLFMELLGFSTQKWITAGGFGTVLITLAGREIFTNFLSSIMIHATRPFVDNEWIQTKIEGQEVSGTVEHVGWWSPTVIRGDDREAVHIPNHKFSVSVVRNLSQKTHWRIKTHLGISHLDVSKMTPIVADMRKVLAKHPQVEQQRLHRRVFFDQIENENQALMILISCFVKTSHFEEYLRVKEIILLDLLKVISHHGARLATPIRSVQRVLDESESRSAPFRDMRNANQSQRRPFLLLNSEVAASDYEEEDDDDDIQDTISRLSEQLAKADKTAASSKDDESAETAKETNDLKPPVPKEVVADGTLQTPVSAQQNTVSTSSDDSLLQETDVNENLMDRIYAGTEETLVKSHTDTGNVHPAHVPATGLVVEMPEEKVPHLYSNNVGLDDVDASSSVSSLNINVHSVVTNEAAVTSEEHPLQITHDKHVGVHVAVEKITSSSTDDPWKQSENNVNGEDEDKDASSVTTTEEHQVHVTQTLKDNHVGVHVAVGKTTSIDDPWKQPYGNNEAPKDVHSVLGELTAASVTTTTEDHQVQVTRNDKHVGIDVALGNTTTTTTTRSIDDPWKQTSTSENDKNKKLEDVLSFQAPTTEEHHVHVTQKVNDKHAGVRVAVASSSTDDPWKQPSTSDRDAKKARGEEDVLTHEPPRRSTEEHKVEFTNNKHVGVTTTTSKDDDPWKTSERDGNNTSGEGLDARSNDPWREPAGTSSSRSSSDDDDDNDAEDDPWAPQNAQKSAASSRPSVDPKLIPGVAIQGPKHTLPLDEDIALPTLVALGKPKSSNERRESAAGPKGGASRDPERD